MIPLSQLFADESEKIRFFATRNTNRFILVAVKNDNVIKRSIYTFDEMNTIDLKIKVSNIIVLENKLPKTFNFDEYIEISYEQAEFLNEIYKFNSLKIKKQQDINVFNHKKIFESKSGKLINYPQITTLSHYIAKRNQLIKKLDF